MAENLPRCDQAQQEKSKDESERLSKEYALVKDKAYYSSLTSEAQKLLLSGLITLKIGQAFLGDEEIPAAEVFQFYLKRNRILEDPESIALLKFKNSVNVPCVGVHVHVTEMVEMSILKEVHQGVPGAFSLRLPPDVAKSYMEILTKQLKMEFKKQPECYQDLTVILRPIQSPFYFIFGLKPEEYSMFLQRCGNLVTILRAWDMKRINEGQGDISSCISKEFVKLLSADDWKQKMENIGLSMQKKEADEFLVYEVMEKIEKEEIELRSDVEESGKPSQEEGKNDEDVGEDEIEISSTICNSEWSCGYQDELLEQLADEDGTVDQEDVEEHRSDDEETMISVGSADDLSQSASDDDSVAEEEPDVSGPRSAEVSQDTDYAESEDHYVIDVEEPASEDDSVEKEKNDVSGSGFAEDSEHIDEAKSENRSVIDVEQPAFEDHPEEPVDVEDLSGNMGKMAVTDRHDESDDEESIDVEGLPQPELEVFSDVDSEELDWEKEKELQECKCRVEEGNLCLCGAFTFQGVLNYIESNYEDSEEENDENQDPSERQTDNGDDASGDDASGDDDRGDDASGDDASGDDDSGDDDSGDDASGDDDSGDDADLESDEEEEEDYDEELVRINERHIV